MSVNTSYGKVALASAVVLLAFAAALLAATAGAGGGSPELLPDLTVQAPTDVGVRRERGRFRLGFESAADNVGDGPLTVDGDRQRPDARRLAGTQLIEHADGSETRIPLAAKLRYVRSSDHSHWHYLGFMRYTLRSPRTGEIVARDHKTGFCLGDRYRTQTDSPLPAEGPPSFRESDCAKGKPDVDHVREGISVGWGDDYQAHLEGQSIDITRLPRGRYLLVHVVNPERSLRELDPANNVSSALIRIGRTRRGRPTARILARCPQSATCSRG